MVEQIERQLDDHLAELTEIDSEDENEDKDGELTEHEKFKQAEELG